MIRLTYRLTVNNFKDEPVAFRLFDRIAHAEDSGEVQIAVGSDVDADQR